MEVSRKAKFICEEANIFRVFVATQAAMNGASVNHFFELLALGKFIIPFELQDLDWEVLSNFGLPNLSSKFKVTY